MTNDGHKQKQLFPTDVALLFLFRCLLVTPSGHFSPPSPSSSTLFGFRLRRPHFLGSSAKSRLLLFLSLATPLGLIFSLSRCLSVGES